MTVSYGVPDYGVPDCASIAGQEHAKRALEVAACGGHSVALIGPPGNGKSLLAKAFVGLLPAGEKEEPRPFMEGLDALAWVEEAMQGPGNLLSRMRQGVLVLDRPDCFGFSPLQLQRLGLLLDHAGIQLIMTIQPCPCGFYGEPVRDCACSAQEIMDYQYRHRALMERVPIAVEIPFLDYARLTDARRGEPSAAFAARVRAGYARQQARFAGLALRQNAAMDHAQVLRFCALDPAAQKLYQAVCQHLHMSVRTSDDLLSVARTIADLAGCEQIEGRHMAEAIQYHPSH